MWSYLLNLRVCAHDGAERGAGRGRGVEGVRGVNIKNHLDCLSRLPRQR